MARSDTDPLASVQLQTLFRPARADRAPESGMGADKPTEPSTVFKGGDHSSEPRRVNPLLDDTSRAGPRYELRSVLGRGGMGEVQLCRDSRIGRDVAVKFVLPKVARSPDGPGRFLREARVQAQLEHPAIVPVHDLEVLADGTVYFTMKRVRGVTLSDVLVGLSRGDEELQQRFSRRRLLSSLSTVCLGIDFAHSRGVVHRDLKPGNVMIGDFGEVYVLDWGVAKVLDTDQQSAALADDEVTDGGVTTLAGDVMGTPGYMAPEQLDGSLGDVDGRSDVYALGSILFEILTGKPLFAGMNRMEILRTTLEGVEALASTRACEADVPPELFDICLTALRRDGRRRLSSARALHEALEQYLEGAQDQERRRRLSQEHAQTAEAALEAALVGGAAYEQHRGDAMRELGRSLALDPDNEGARATMLRLLTEPPRTPPPEVWERLEESDAGTVRMGARLNAPMVLAWLPFLPLAAWSGIRNWSLVGLIFALLTAAMLCSLWVARQRRSHLAVEVMGETLTLLAYVVVTRICGPFLFFPALVAIYCVVLQTHPQRRARNIALALSVAALVAPFALEALGVLPPSYTFENGAMIVHPQMLELREGPITLLVLLGTLGILVLPAVWVARIRVSLTEAERRVQTTAWHLERLVPAGPPTTTTTTTTTTATKTAGSGGGPRGAERQPGEDA